MIIRMGQVEASGIVDADRRELFLFTDWCYNLPEWFPAIKKAWIVRLPNSDGSGKVTHYLGTIMGEEMEWEGQSVEWKENEIWMMRAFKGKPAKLTMWIKFVFEPAVEGKTKVTGFLGYGAPYLLIGPLIDQFYIRREAMRLIKVAIEGMKIAADQGKIPSVELQFEKRKADRLDYALPSISNEKIPR